MKRVLAAALTVLALGAFTAPALADCSPGHSAQKETRSDKKTGA